MLVAINFGPALNRPVVQRTGVGSFDRSFPLPIEVSGVSISINGVACGIKSVTRNQIFFVTPDALLTAIEGTVYPMVINFNGTVVRGEITFVPARPDIFAIENFGPGGRADILNVTNRVHTREPFTVTSILIRGGKRVPTRFRIRVTGMKGVATPLLSFRIGPLVAAGVNLLSGPDPESPGVQIIEFQMPPELDGAGDVPITLDVIIGTTQFSSRLADTAPRVRIL
jgi:uncharacterized protein (TIGR03437 family)